MITKMGRGGDTEVIKEAKKRFAAHLDGSCSLPADLRAAVSQLIKYLLNFFFILKAHTSKYQEILEEISKYIKEQIAQ